MNHVVSFTKSLVLVAAMLFASPAARALDSGDIFVVSAQGDVRVTMNGAVRAVRAGSVLELPASVRTGHDGSIELRQGATTVSVGRDTVLEFPALERRGGPIDRIQQSSGNAFYSIGKRDGRKLRVETPYLVGVVKGTQFNVAAQQEATTISLFEGRLEVRAPDDSSVMDLEAGEIAARRRGDASITVIPMEQGEPLSTMPPRVQGEGDVIGDADATHDPGVDANLFPSTTVSAGPVTPDVGVAVNVDVAAQVGVAADVGGAVNVDVAPDAITADLSPAANLGAGPLAGDLSPSVGVDLPATGVAVDDSLSAAVTAGPTVQVDANTGVDLGPAGVAADIGTATEVVAGPVEIDSSAAISIGTGASVDLGAATTIETAPVTVGIDTGVSVDVGAGNVSADLTAGTSVDAGPVTADLAASTEVSAGTGSAITVDTAADLGVVAVTPVDVSVGVDAGVDVSQGTVDVGVSVGGADLGLDVDLGLGGSEPVTDTGSSTTPATDTGNTGSTDVGGLLDGLLRRTGRK